MKKIILSVGLFITLTGCTENERAKHYGGTMTIDLPPKTKLVTATWKESELWYLYQPRQDNEQPKTSTFMEDSSFGILQGKVVFNEK